MFVSRLTRLFNNRAFRQYVMRSLAGIFRQPHCALCGTSDLREIDRKLFTGFYKCNACQVNFRFPADPAGFQSSFYRDGYVESGLTTDFPSQEQLEILMASNFKGSEKDMHILVEIFELLKIRRGARLVEFGANWGYCSYQLKQFGYEVQPYELSAPRAKLGLKLGIDVRTQLSELKSGNDAAFSIHVIEHVSNPKEFVLSMLNLVNDGGLALCLTPNGSEQYKRVQPQAYNQSWGLSHPVLLDELFISKAFASYRYFVSSSTGDSLHREIEQWGFHGQFTGAMDGANILLTVMKNS